MGALYQQEGLWKSSLKYVGRQGGERGTCWCGSSDHDIGVPTEDQDCQSCSYSDPKVRLNRPFSRCADLTCMGISQYSLQ